MENEKDRRVIKTKRSIQSSLVEMMKDTPYQEISVTNLCKRADIGRGTFYLHYNDIYEVVQELEDSLLESFKDIAFQYFEEENTQGLQKLISACLTWIQNNPDMFRVFLFPSNYDFYQRFETYAIDLFYYHSLKYHPTKAPAETRYSITKDFCGIIGAVRIWFKEGMSVAQEAISKVLVQ